MSDTTQPRSLFFTDAPDLEPYSLREQFAEHLEYVLVKDRLTATPADIYQALAKAIRDRLIHNWLRTQRTHERSDAKRVYYLSLEFLMGRLLGNALVNLDFHDQCRDIMHGMGYDLDEIRDQEQDMGLGNGGLGRLAACFLDSMAALELPAFGYGIRYEFGIFDQEIRNGYQIEIPDDWLGWGNPWEVMRPEFTCTVRFGGEVRIRRDESGWEHHEWVSTDDVLAVPWDVPIPGYRNATVNNLRLWQARARHDFDLPQFSMGDYYGAVESKFASETISKVLYPNDSVQEGRLLRLKQQYFFVSASLQDIIRQYRMKHSTFATFADKVAIQLNDTHPAIAIPELMRILVDVEQLPWEEAWAITTGTFAYTNHTVLPEALERWPVRLLEELLPRHMQIILEINHRFLEEVRATQMDDAMVQAMSIIEEGDEQRVRMANLAIIGSHAVNGVAELHTRILKESLFAAFHRHQPGKFTNKTNGISQRRWLRKCNPGLAELITEAIGDGWVKDPMLLRGLEPLADDDVFIAHWIAVRRANKRRLAELVHRDTGVIIEPDSLFDAHIKRFHEYKRQLLTILHVLTLYTRILDAPMKAMVPRTVIFSGKAAPGYLAAKLHIKLINAIADHVNTDPVTRGRLRVVFLKNYSVSLAERIIPAADLSEQVSTAGYEASGTGNMKFMMNGALTIGTLDGATIEIRDAVGEENIFTFGLTDEAVRVLRREGHSPQELYWSTPQLQRVMNLLRDNVFNPGEPGIFQPVFDSLYHTDWYCLLADYASYIATQDRVSEAYRDARTWARMSIINTARSGRFSSDRTIREYADEIWHVQPVPVDPTFGSAPGALDGAE